MPNKSIGVRAFCLYAPKPWNSLPLDIRRASSTDTFKMALKTFLLNDLFNLAFTLE